MQYAGTPSIFISYSHADEPWKDRLVKHLLPLERDGVARLWHDRAPRPGEQISAALDGGGVAILLLSADFLASDAICREELPRLLSLAGERRIRIVPVLLASCGWQDAPAISRLQMWPAHLTPLSRVADPDAELASLASELRRLVQPAPAAPAPSAPRGFVPPEPDKVFLSGLPRTGSLLLGRDVQIRLLDQAWSQGSSNVACLSAWGGVGKSALINGWLNGMARDHFRGARRVYAWSFDRQGTRQRAASADEFFAAAFRWFRGGETMPNDPLERAERLAGLIRGERTLLVLDGVEPLQHPSGMDEGQLKDPALSTLLRELAAWNEGGLCLVSSRLAVRDLDEFGDRVLRLPLERLSAEAGAELLRTRGVRGPDEELRRAVEEYQGHALALNLLAGYLVDVYEGDVARRADVPAGDLAAEGAERVLRAYDEWYADRPAGAALRLMGFFDRPAAQGAMRALMRAPAIPGLTEPLQRLPAAEWARTVSTLRRASLLARPNEDAPGEVDTHPLVRAYYERQVSQQSPDAWREANGRLYEHYRDEARPLPATLDEMQPLLLALVHGCRAGRHREALHEVLIPRVMRRGDAYILRELGAYGALLTSLAGFCEPGDWSHAAGELAEEDQLLVLPVVAQCLLVTRGYASHEVQDCFHRVQELALRLDRPGHLHMVLVARWRASLVTRGLPETLRVARELQAYTATRPDPGLNAAAEGILAFTFYYMGDLRAARAHATAGLGEWEQVPAATRATEFYVPLACNLLIQGLVLWHQGAPGAAREHLQTAVHTARRHSDTMSLVMALFGASYLAQFRRDGQAAIAAASELGETCAAQGNRLYSAIALVLKGWGTFHGGDAAEGAALMQQGITRYQDLGTGMNLSYFYSLLAEAQIALGDLDQAAASLQRAVRMAEQFEEAWWSAETLRLAGVVQRERGDVDGAAATFRAAMELARSYGSRALERRAAASLVRLLRRQGQGDRVEAVRRSFREAAPA